MSMAQRNGIKPTHTRREKARVTVVKRYENGVLDFSTESGVIGIITEKDFLSLYTPTSEDNVFEDIELHEAEFMNSTDDTDDMEGYTRYKNHFGAQIRMKNSVFKAIYTPLVSLQNNLQEEDK